MERRAVGDLGAPVVLDSGVLVKDVDTLAFLRMK